MLNMSTIFRKNINLKNIRQIKILLRNINHECCIFRPNSLLITSASRHQYFATSALPKYNHNEIKEKENNEAENLSNVTQQKDVDQAFLEMDYSVRRTGRCSRRSVEHILSLIDKLSSASDVHGLYLLRCCGLMHLEKPTERVKLASAIWEKLHKFGVELDVKHYNSILKVFVDCNHQFLPSEFLASMESSQIEPNKATYLLLLQKYCNDGNLNGAGEILQCLKEKGLPINESVFTILIKGHMRANDVSGAKDILEVMRSANLSPTSESYVALACGYAEKGNTDDLNFVLAEASNHNVVLSNKHYLDIISSFSDAENEKINELLAKITDVHDWRQEIANVMMELVYKGMGGVAFQLLLKIAHPENNFANIFMRILLKCDSPKEKILHYCEEISDRRLHNHILMNTAKAAIDVGNVELALSLFETLQKKGIPVRINNLHLLLSSVKDEEKSIWLTLKKMFELGVPAEFYTYLEYVFPAVSVSNPEAVISKIQETGHSFSAAIDPLFEFYCFHGELDNALYLVEKYPVTVHPSFSLENYINIHKDIQNYSNAFFKVLNYLLQNNGVPHQDSEVAQGMNLATLILKDHSLFEALLRTPDEQIQLSKKSYEICANILKRNNPDSLRYLRRLGNSRNYSSEKKVSRSIAGEEKELELLKEKGMPTQRYLLECLSAHLKARNITRVNELIEELDKEGAQQYPPTVLSSLIYFHCQNNDLEMAEKYFKVLKSDCPTFKLDSLKVIDYATLLVKCSKFDDAVNVIKMECQDLHLFGYSETSFRKCVRNLLNIAVETGNSDLVKNLQDSLSPHTETLQANVLFEPLVKMHLYKNDLDSALNEFEKCVKNQRISPCLKILMKKCIISENSAKLDFVIKTASSLVGKQLVLYDLVMAFLETGRRSEAKKILENLKDKSYFSYLEDICSQLYNQNRVFELLDLVNLFWAVDHIDKEKIIHYLLKLSWEHNDLKTAQDLYNSISKTFKLSDEMKDLFSNVLSKNLQQVPSTVSKIDVSTFLQCVRENDAHQALKNLQSMKKGVVRTLELSQLTDFLDLSLKNKILSDLSQNVNAMSYLIENAYEVLKPLLEKYSSSGDIDSLIEISNFFPDFALKKCSFNNYLSNAYISSEKYEDLLSELEKRWDKNNKLFSISAFVELLKRPDLEERVIRLAKKYLESNFDVPIAVVWAHYLILEHYEEADAFYKSHSVPADKVDSLVLRTVRQQENVNLGMAYISIIKNTDASKRCLTRIYGTVLDVLVLKEMYDDAAALVVEAQAKDIDIEKHYQSTLITLKNALEREKKNVPFSTPAEGHVISE